MWVAQPDSKTSLTGVIGDAVQFTEYQGKYWQWNRGIIEMEIILNARKILVGLVFLSSSVIAGEYNASAYVGAADYDGKDVYEVGGYYYFDQVDTSGKALAEAWFMGRHSSINLNYVDVSGLLTETSAYAEFLGDRGNNFYGGIGYVNTDYDAGGTDDSLYGEIGYFVADNWLISVATEQSDGEDPVYLYTKYASELADGRFLNLEAWYDDQSRDKWISGDFYFSQKTSVGLTLSEQENYKYGLEFRHFFTEQFSLSLRYRSYDNYHITGASLSARF